MAEQQFLVRLVNGSTRCVRFAASEVFCEDLKSRVFEIEGIPAGLQRIVTGTREIQDGDVLSEGVGNVAVLLRLRGGKGGFGSLLRGAASKAGQKKTSNFDACRDMSGRRLRHVNGEKRVKEWHEEAPLRQLETVALDYMKKESRKRKNESSEVDDLRKFREQVEQNSIEVQAAVLDGLKRGKKKKQKKSDISGKAKKLVEDLDKSDIDDLIPTASEQPSSSKFPGSSTADESVKETVVADRVEEVQAEAPTSAIIEEVEPVSLVEEAEPSSLVGEVINVASEAHPVIVPSVAEVQQQTPVKSEEPIAAVELRLEDFESAKDVEALGLERLKSELQKRGLKCGGNLAERAARLFLLKSTPIEKLEKKHFAAKFK